MSADIARRHEIKSTALADAVDALRKDPKAYELADCGSGSGLCIAQPNPVPRAQVTIPPTARLPQIERKIAVVLGVNDYADPIPSLKTPVRDADAVAGELENKFGYEVRKVSNPTKEQIVEQINRVIEEAAPTDSVVIYYAGHGYVLDETKTGYWMPADASAKSPENWLSNRDITRMLSRISAKQVMLVSDSCFSGKLTEGSDSTELAKPTATPSDVLDKRSVVVLSSGGDEPVADQGRNGHSIFAHHLLENLGQMADVGAGQQFFATLRDAVTREFPQQPQYSPVIGAGHQPGGDFLIEPREKSVVVGDAATTAR